MAIVMVVAFAASLLQVGPARQDTATEARTTEARTWIGCVQAGTAPATYRLNLDETRAGTTETTATTGTTGTTAPGQNPMGRPFVHLVGEDTTFDLTEHVGRRVEVTGRELSEEEAEEEAAKRPNRQEAAETAAGTGGESPGHFRYVRVTRVQPVAGTCE
jgi:hypothetical protein